MIDLQARSKLAEASRSLVAGLITNHQFDDRIPRSSDPAIREIYNKAFWLMYCDLRKYRLKGRDRLSPQAREVAARCILFLKSNLPYGWPVLTKSAAVLLTIANLFTLGIAGRIYSYRATRGREIAYWPFLSSEQYSAALRSPAYLSGNGL
ncbi:hypothetical protein ACPPVV_17710 [Rhodanobacter sp. Col0626]|uniref:hypothetical protein n=1 Tax=Rhodanobacter sp. Col0626 TaxID=3415679 RepID=UPI003CF33F09